ncbi:MAG: O-antigen ligase family protein [Pirellulales bacterium]|nr:O-antigen ligase family protein [Pirellulales bacterium]
MKGLLFTYALTYGGALASLVNPFIGLLIYVCFAIIKPESLWHYSVPAGNYSRIVAAALLAGWAFQGFGDWNFGRARVVVWSLLGFMAWYMLSAIFAINQEVAWGDVEAKGKVVLPFLVGITIVRSPAQLKQLAWVIMLSQGFVAYEANMSYLTGGFNWIREIGFGGMDNNCCAIAMVCGTGFAFFLGLAETGWKRWLAFAAAAFMAHAIMISNSRGGMLALMITGGASFVLIRKQPVHYVYLLLAVIVGVRMAGPSVWERFNTTFAAQEDRDESAQSRIDLWKVCLQITASNPIFGIGPNNTPLVTHEYGFTKGKSPHTLWLQTASDLGLPGIAMLLTFYFSAILGLWRLAKEFDPLAPELADSCRMVIAALIGFMVAAQFVSLLGLELPFYVALVGAGYLKFSGALLASFSAAHYEEPNEIDTAAEHSLLAATS